MKSASKKLVFEAIVRARRGFIPLGTLANKDLYRLVGKKVKVEVEVLG